MKVRYITTAEGEMALVPRAEHERLVARDREMDEDIGTVRLVARAKREIAGGMPLLPKEAADRLANGANPLRVLREFRDLTQAELAVAAGITQGYLSDIETGKRKGPFELHRKFATALGVPFELLAPIAVTLAEAEPERIERRKRFVREMKSKRGR